MNGNRSIYGEELYNQLMNVMRKLDALTEESADHKREIKRLTNLTESLTQENVGLKKELCEVKNQLANVNAENTKLKAKNEFLRDDNERMERILSKNRHNSSLPSSTDEKPTKPVIVPFPRPM